MTQRNSHDEGKCARSVTGVHGSVMGVQNKGVTRGGPKWGGESGAHSPPFREY